MGPAAAPDWQAFIRANTRVLTPPLVPEIALHLADETLAIWSKTEEELAADNLPPPFWAFAWAGGQALARYLLDTPAVVAGRRVLDIGAGSGLTAIAAMKAGAARVVATEIDPVAVAAIEVNARLNGVEIAVACRDVLDEAPPEDIGVVLVGDVFYERALAERLIAFAARAADRDAVVFVGDPRRSYFPADRFASVARFSVPVSRELEDFEIRDTQVWRWRASTV
jgi:predicted nicotinamide N-methyase